MRRNRPVVIVTVAALGESGLEVFLDAAIEQAHSPNVAALGIRVGGTL
jgi:hypothetical protein